MLIIYLWVSLATSCTGTTGYHYRTQNKLQANGKEQATFLRRRVLDLQHYSYSRRQADSYRPPEHPHLNNTYFCPMPEMEQRGASLVNEDNYPWLAKVIHCRFNNNNIAPLICTAAAVSKKIFITAARCIVTAKAEYTMIAYRDRQIGVKAFIYPVKPSKQMFDDVGLIVVWKPWKYQNVEYIINFTLPKDPRPDGDSYDFFENMTRKPLTVIGFIKSGQSPETHELYKLENMHASNRVCNAIYPVTKNSNDYWVPCVHSCGPEDHGMNSETCGRYLLGLGHMVVDEETNELIGIVSWTCGNSARDRLSRKGLPLPLGLAVPNKKTLNIDLECAQALANDIMNPNGITPGYNRDVCIDMYGP